MRIDPNTLPSFSGELPALPPMTYPELRREAALLKRELYAVHALWLRSHDPQVLSRQMQLSMALERVLHQAEAAKAQRQG